MYTFKIESATEICPKVLTIVKAFGSHHPVASKLGIKFDVDLDFYLNEAIQDKLICVGIYNQEELIGCYLAIIIPYMLNKNMKCANELLWCIHPKYQKTRAAFELIKYLEEVLPFYGVSVWGLAVPHTESHPRLGQGMEKLGYKSIETIYMRKV